MHFNRPADRNGAYLAPFLAKRKPMLPLRPLAPNPRRFMNNFTGLMDEVFVFDRTLSPDEIRKLYQTNQIDL